MKFLIIALLLLSTANASAQNFGVHPSADSDAYKAWKAQIESDQRVERMRICSTYSPTGPYGSVTPSGYTDASGAYHSCEAQGK